MVTESDHIVAETAARIFADLADPQTINRARDGAWKEPLWRALADAGLPLAWVPEAQGGAGASLADGFAILGAAGRYALPVPLAETLIAGWLLARAGIAAPAGAMTVAPVRPRDRITLNADGSLSGRAAEFLSPRECETHRGRRRERQRRGDRPGQNRRLPHERRRKSRRRGVGQRDLRARRSRSRSAPAPAGFDASALMLMGATVRSVEDRRRAGSDPVAQRRLRQ